MKVYKFITCMMVTITLPILHIGKTLINKSMTFPRLLMSGKKFTESPVLLFPGLGASRLLKGTHNIYPPSFNQYIFHTKKWQKEMTENRNLTTFPFGDKRGLDMSVSLFSSNRNVYHRMIHQEPDIYPIPYDFRLVDKPEYMDELCHRLKTYIETFRKPVILMCHSSGGLVAHWFLHKQPLTWRKQWIDSVVNINVPFGGTVMVLENCIREDVGVSRLVGKALIRSLGATVLNMPDTRYLNTSVLTYNGKDVKDYLEFFELDDIRKRLKQNQDVIDSFKEWTGVETHIVYSTTDPTSITPITIYANKEIKIYNDDEKRIEGTGDSLSYLSGRPNGSPDKYGNEWNIETHTGDGDGVVSLESLIVPRVWKATPDLVIFHHVPRSGHSTIFNEESL